MDCVYLRTASLEPSRLYLRADFAALTGSTVSRRRQISRWTENGVEKRESRQMQDSWQGQTSRPSSDAAYTLYLARALLRFCCRLLSSSFVSLFSPLLSSWQKICVHVHTKRPRGIRGRGRLRSSRRWGLYAQVGR